MRYSKGQIEALANAINRQFGERLNHFEEPMRSFLAGLISVEAGKSGGRFNESAKRFEPHVFEALRAVRDGKKRSYNGLTRNDLSGMTDEALRNLATSWGATQIMGWHVLKNLKTTIAELRDPNKHLAYAARLLEANANVPGYMQRGDFASVYRIWNTGSPKGRTHDPDYVTNANAVREFYARNYPKNGKIEQAVAPAVVEEKVVAIREPEPYNGIGFWATIRRDLTVAGAGNITLGSIFEFLQQSAGIPDWAIPVIKTAAYGILIVTVGWFIFRVVHYVVDSWKQARRVEQEIKALEVTKC